MTRVRAGLYVLLLLAVTIKVLWFTLEPVIPYAAVAFILVCIYLSIFRRKW